jgi:hypothetical protein
MTPKAYLSALAGMLIDQPTKLPDIYAPDALIVLSPPYLPSSSSDRPFHPAGSEVGHAVDNVGDTRNEREIRDDPRDVCPRE